MNNLYDDISGNPQFNRLEVGGLLFAEYTCPLEARMFGIWTEHDYLVHVVSGKKTWHTPNGSWTVESGQTLFFKKGAAVVEQFFESDFCVMLFFIPDEFVRKVITEHPDLAQGSVPDEESGCAVPVESDVALGTFFESMKGYFSGGEQPTDLLLQLKLKELVVGILTSRVNPALAAYFRGLAGSSAPSLQGIMEANFRYRLSLEDFARLTHRSLSSFKRDFRKTFNETPGKWLLQKRLDYAAAMLRSNQDWSITDVAFESGFEDMSHFSKSFRSRFESSPSEFRELQSKEK